MRAYWYRVGSRGILLRWERERANAISGQERESMSKMKEWLLDNQLNGDDGTGFNDYKESEEE